MGDNSLLNKSKHPLDGRKHIVCKVPLPSFVEQDSSDDRDETEEHTSGDHDAEMKSSDVLPSAGRTRLGRQSTAPDLLTQRRRSSRRRDRKIELEKQRMKINVYRGI